jgi:hypothetical protein
MLGKNSIKGLAIAVVVVCAVSSVASERYRRVLLQKGGDTGKMVGYFIPEIDDEVVVGFTGYVGRKGANESAAIATLRSGDSHPLIIGLRTGYARSTGIMSLQSGDKWIHVLALEDEDGNRRVGKFKAGSELSGKVNIAPPPDGYGDATPMDAGFFELGDIRYPIIVGIVNNGRTCHAAYWLGPDSGSPDEKDWETGIMGGEFMASEALGCRDLNPGAMHVFGRVMHSPGAWQAAMFQFDGKSWSTRLVGPVMDPDSDGDGLDMIRNPLYAEQKEKGQNALYDGHVRKRPGRIKYSGLLVNGQTSLRGRHRGHVTVLKRTEDIDVPTLGPFESILAVMGQQETHARTNRYNGVGKARMSDGSIGPVRWMSPELLGVPFTPGYDDDCNGVDDDCDGFTTTCNGVDDDCDGVVDAVCVAPNGMFGGSVGDKAAIFVPTNHYSPDRIKRPKRIDQTTPLLMWNDDGESYDVPFERVSERLRHKQRAITIFDYERLVLHPSSHKGIVKGKIKNEVEVEKESAAAPGPPGTVKIGLWNHKKGRWVNIMRPVFPGPNDISFEMPGAAASYVNSDGVMSMKLEYEFRGHVTVLKAKHDEVGCTIVCGCTHL